MDIVLLISVASLIVILIVLCTVFLGRKPRGAKQQNEGQPRPQGRLIRRAAGQRIARRRMQANINYHANDEENESGDDASDEAEDKPEFPSQKVGAKKQAKLAAKQEKRIQREAAEREREERKKREQVLQDERNKQYEKECAEEQKKEEEERIEREKKEQKEHEEYMKLKEAFNIEEEGYDLEETENENLLQEFISYIKEHKVVVLEDLAAHFRMKAASVVERIQELQGNGSLTGVIDDRGKFIYISQEELEAVAKFVKQRGRVSISELVENSNQLINLNPSKRCTLIEAR